MSVIKDQQEMSTELQALLVLSQADRAMIADMREFLQQREDELITTQELIDKMFAYVLSKGKLKVTLV